MDNHVFLLKTAPFSKSTFFSKDLIPLNVGKFYFNPRVINNRVI
jgi:hypothetical protein